jgi:hypothetical protein
MVATLAGLPLSEPMQYCELVVLVCVPRRRGAGRPADGLSRLHDAGEHIRDFTPGRVSVDMSGVAVVVLAHTFRDRPVRAVELQHRTVALGPEMAGRDPRDLRGQGDLFRHTASSRRLALHSPLPSLSC